MDIDQAGRDQLMSLAPPETEILAAARATGTELTVAVTSRPVGVLLRWLATIGPAHDVVEIGSGVGYGALCLLDGMHPRGILTTIEIDPDRHTQAQRALGRSGHGQRARTILGAALTVLPKLSERSYDIVFVDGAIDEYRDYLDHARRLLRPGGMLVADHLVAHDAQARDASTAIDAFMAGVRDDPTLDVVPLSVGAGVVVATYRPPS